MIKLYTQRSLSILFLLLSITGGILLTYVFFQTTDIFAYRVMALFVTVIASSNLCAKFVVRFIYTLNGPRVYA